MKDVERLYGGDGTVEVYCDNSHCSRKYTYDFFGGLDFRDCQEEIKTVGWISRKVDDEWYDFCCKECYYVFLKERENNKKQFVSVKPSQTVTPVKDSNKINLTTDEKLQLKIFIKRQLSIRNDKWNLMTAEQQNQEINKAYNILTEDTNFQKILCNLFKV